MSASPYQLPNKVTLDSVDALYTETLQTLKASDLWQIDLSNVTEFDSGILALVIELAREAQRHKQSLLVSHLPNKLPQLIDLYGLTDVFAYLTRENLGAAV